MNSFIKILIPALSFIVLISEQSCKHEPVIPEENVCYDNTIKGILATNCAIEGCHNSIIKIKGFDFSNYNSVMASKTIIPGNPDGSVLFDYISGKKDLIMPPWPVLPLSTENKKLIYIWIKQGANEKCN